MPTPETLARRVAKAAVFPAGLRRGRRRGDVVILLYHRIGSTGREVDVPSATFERHLRLLRSAGDAISLDDVRVGRGGVVVTFDDGYRDFTDTVVPLLVRYGVAGTLYLQTGLVTGDCEAVGERLDWAALSDAVTTGLVTIGAHTHTHADLARGSGVEAEDEMRRSQELIEDRLGRACDHFAYPYGIASEAADGAARRLFATAALGNWRTNRRDRFDLHRLGRVPVTRSDGVAFFRAKTRGLLENEALVYRALRRGPWRRPA